MHPQHSRGAAEKRHLDFTKAIRKQNLYPGYYDNLHQFSKNKIHCSCWMCAFHGPSMQDIRRTIDMNQQMDEFKMEEAIA